MASNYGVATPMVLREIFGKREDAVIELPEDVIGFRKSLPREDFTLPTEVPPTSGSYSNEMLAATMASPALTFNEAFIHFVMFVYATNGRITYQTAPAGYVVTITWPPRPASSEAKGAGPAEG